MALQSGIRREIIRWCKRRGWMIQPAALNKILKHVVNTQGESHRISVDEVLDSVLKEIADYLENRHGRKVVISEKVWDEVRSSALAPIQNSKRRKQTKSSKSSSSFGTLVNAFETPKLIYDSLAMSFRVEEKCWPLLGTVEQKMSVMEERFELVRQRILRHDLFKRQRLQNHMLHDQMVTEVDQHKLEPIQSLLGKQSDQSSVLVLGILSRRDDRDYYLEDPGGQIQVVFDDAVAFHGSFITENSLLLVDATFQDGILCGHRILPPLVETRETTLQLLQHQIRHPQFHLESQGYRASDPTFCILSDVHLDQPHVVSKLEHLLKSYEESCSQAAEIPTFVFMGNFVSYTATNKKRTWHSAWEQLSKIIVQFEFLATNAQFIFVPGPNDTNSRILPQPPLTGLSKYFSGVHNVHWASNPCRIFLPNGQEMVCFRYDIMAWMMQNQICLPERLPDDMASKKSPIHRMIKTILDQGHLNPVAGAPIYWNYDHALRLFPIPNVVVLGGGKSNEDGFHEVYADCDILNPGFFSSQRSPYVLLGEKSNGPVQFCHVEESEEHT